jgi:hypothetical protein
MSADNGVYILVTIRDRRMNGIASIKATPYKVYRVAHVSAIDNFDYYKENQPYNIGAYLEDNWGKSEVFEDKDKAYLTAHALADTINYLEYGISIIETDYKMYGD